MKIKIPHSVIVKSPGLLPMMYKVSELSEELAIPVSTLRDWLSFGAPHERDSNNHIWVNGSKFRIWVDESRKIKPAKEMEESQGWCFSCRKSVDMKNVQLFSKPGSPKRLRGICVFCSSVVNRGVKKHD